MTHPASTHFTIVAERNGSVAGFAHTILEQNTPAQGFHEARGGVLVERRTGGPFPGGGTAAVFVYAWADPSILIREI